MLLYSLSPVFSCLRPSVAQFEINHSVKASWSSSIDRLRSPGAPPNQSASKSFISVTPRTRAIWEMHLYQYPPATAQLYLSIIFSRARLLWAWLWYRRARLDNVWWWEDKAVLWLWIGLGCISVFARPVLKWV